MYFYPLNASQFPEMSNACNVSLSRVSKLEAENIKLHDTKR